MSHRDTASTSIVRSFCRICTAHCGALVHVRDGRAVRIEGDPDHVLSKGHFCVKGKLMNALNEHPQRLLAPALQRNGQRVAASWDAVLDDLANRLRAIRGESGPDSIGLYLGTAGMFDQAGREMAMALMSALGSKSLYTSVTVDMPAKLLIPELMAGTPWLIPVLDLPSAKCVIFIGQNPLVSHGATAYLPDPRWLKRIRERGDLWVIDTRKTETARQATRHLSPRPGSDYAILAYLARELITDGCDTAYIRDHTIGLEALSAAVAHFDRATTAARTGLREIDLTELLAVIRRHRHISIVSGTGVTMASNANATEWLSWVVQILTGSYERPGGRWFNRSFSSQPLTGPMPSGSGEAEPGPPSRPDLPRRWGQYPCAALADEIEGGHLRALLVVGGNPLIAFPQPDRLKKTLQKLHALAVWDVIPSAIERVATHSLAAMDGLERADLCISMALPDIVGQYTAATIAARGEQRPVWWSLAQLAQRIGVNILPPGANINDPQDEGVLADIASRGRASLATLKSAGRAQIYARDGDWAIRYAVSDSRWRLAPPPLLQALKDAEARACKPTAALVLSNRREPRHSNSTLADGAGRKAAQPFIYIHPEDAAHRTITSGTRVRVSSAFGELTGEAALDAGLRRGVVAIPHGFETLNVAHLTSSTINVDPLTGMIQQTGLPLTLQRIDTTDAPQDA